MSCVLNQTAEIPVVQKAWDIKSGTPLPKPEGLYLGGEELKNEILTGLEVPPELVQADGTGAYAGRTIPLTAFLSSMERLGNQTLCQYDKQILSNLVKWKYGPDHAPYSFEQLPLIKEFLDSEGNSETGEDLSGPEENEDQKTPVISRLSSPTRIQPRT